MGRDLVDDASAFALMKVPNVSIIVPCYNGGRFLDGLVENLAQQEFRDFEVIVINDGSNEQATLDKLASLDSAIKVIHQSNKGLPAARNTGFEAAHADFVLPLDCDDRLHPRFLSEAVAELTENRVDAAFVFTDMRVTGQLEGIWPRRFNRFDHLFLNRLPYCILIKKKAWQAVGGYDERMRDGYEDWEFSIRLALHRFTGIAIKKPMFIYYLSSDGMLISKSARMFGRLWSYIRHKHAGAYKLDSITSLHSEWRSESRLVGLWRARAILLLVRVLPNRAVDFMFFLSLRGLHWWRMRRDCQSVDINPARPPFI